MPVEEHHEQPPKWFPWLADAPLFIDGQQLAALYDAVLRPEFRTVSVANLQERTQEVWSKYGGEAGVGLPAWFPWLTLSAKVNAAHEQQNGAAESQSVTLEPVDRPERKLVELAFHYAVHLQDRIWFTEGDSLSLPTPETILESPRLFTVIDFPPGTKFMPMAAELNSGQVRVFYNELIDKFRNADGGTLPPRYPDDPKKADYQKKQAEYWSWFSDPDHWHAGKAIEVIEKTVGRKGRPQWIDYRVPIKDAETLHLHVAGRGEFDTGVFAYNLVKRGWKHGLRVVGTLKSEPDLNVLAIYEK